MLEGSAAGVKTVRGMNTVILALTTILTMRTKLFPRTPSNISTMRTATRSDFSALDHGLDSCSTVVLFSVAFTVQIVHKLTLQLTASKIQYIKNLIGHQFI